MFTTDNTFTATHWIENETFSSIDDVEIVVSFDWEKPYREGFYHYGGFSIVEVISIDGIPADNVELSDADKTAIIEMMEAESCLI